MSLGVFVSFPETMIVPPFAVKLVVSGLWPHVLVVPVHVFHARPCFPDAEAAARTYLAAFGGKETFRFTGGVSASFPLLTLRSHKHTLQEVEKVPHIRLDFENGAVLYVGDDVPKFQGLRYLISVAVDS